MASTLTIRRNAQAGSINAADNFSVSADGAQERNIALPASSTDVQVLMNLDVSQLKALALVADKDVTIETNNASTPTDTINLKANRALIWESESGYFANPLTADVTALFLTSVEAANVQMVFIEDATP